MERNLIPRLHRMRDVGPVETANSRAIVDRISQVLTDRGFDSLDTPVLEHTDLFVRKSGGEISGSLYTFSDPGGIGVSLRPEFTPSVIRWFIDNALDHPEAARFQYSGPVFRYGGSRGARFRQFHQIGAELIGVEAAEGDIEILLTANECLQAADVGRYMLRLGHIGVVRDLVESLGLTEPLQMLVISNLSDVLDRQTEMNDLETRAAAAGLIHIETDESAPRDGDRLAAKAALEAIGNSLPAQTGRRTPEQILTRLVNRLEQAVPVETFASAAETVAGLVSAEGSATHITDHARDMFDRSGASTRSIDQLDSVLTALINAGVNERSIQLDLTFVRGLAYYTGIVFEFSAAAPGDGYVLGGGGRYDDLVRAFGGADIPACGFALNVDELTWSTSAHLLKGSR